MIVKAYTDVTNQFSTEEMSSFFPFFFCSAIIYNSKKYILVYSIFVYLSHFFLELINPFTKVSLGPEDTAKTTDTGPGLPESGVYTPRS